MPSTTTTIETVTPRQPLAVLHAEVVATLVYGAEVEVARLLCHSKTDSQVTKVSTTTTKLFLVVLLPQISNRGRLLLGPI